MGIQSTKNILLLGAGFSKNFGAPLANEMWYLIFNHEKIQAQPRIKQLMLNNFDYESIYASVLAGFTDKEGLFGKRCSFIEFEDEEKDSIKTATYFAYEHIDEIFIEYMKKHNISESDNKKVLTGVAQFISFFPPRGKIFLTSDGKSVAFADGKILMFAPDRNDKAFIFTLNQDLFFERAYPEYDGRQLCIPGIQSRKKLFENGINKKLEDSDFCELSNEDELRNKDILSEGSFFLIKLHGSYNWRNLDGSRAMVIGRHKETQIQKEPLLSRYFDIFKEVLSQDQRRLLIVGYGFGDEHINHVISSAVKDNGLKIYILSPESLQELKKKLPESCEDFINIYNGISGYFPYTEILTGDIDTDRTIRKYVYNVFFGSDYLFFDDNE